MSKVLEGLMPQLYEGMPRKKKKEKKVPEKDYYPRGRHPRKGNWYIQYLSHKEIREVWED